MLASLASGALLTRLGRRRTLVAFGLVTVVAIMALFPLAQGQSGTPAGLALAGVLGYPRTLGLSVILGLAGVAAPAGPLHQVRQRVGAKTGAEAVDADLDPVAAPVDWSKGDEDALAPDMGAAVTVLDDRVAGGDEGQQSDVGEGVGDGSLDAAPDRPASGRVAGDAGPGHRVVKHEDLWEPAVPE